MVIVTWQHGTISGYARCNGGGKNACCACREANRIRGAEIRERTGEHPNDLIDASPAMVIVAVLRGRDYSNSAISRLAGVPTSVIHRLAKRQGTWVTRETSSRLDDALTYATAHPDAGRKDQWVDAARTHQQMRSLAALGWSLAWQRRQLGFSGGVGAFRYGRISKVNAAKVQDLYDRFGGTHGPSKVAAEHARRLGWHVPLAYDDDGQLIPGAIPDPLSAARERRERRHERETEIERLTAADVSAREIAERLGVTARTVTRVRARRAS